MFNLRHKIFEWVTSRDWYSKFNKDLISFRGYNFCIYLYAGDSHHIFDRHGFNNLIYDAVHWTASPWGYSFYCTIQKEYIDFLNKLWKDEFWNS